MVEADRYFATQKYAQCQQYCYDILQSEPSEAIQARCDMYLLREEVTPGHVVARAYVCDLQIV